MRKTHRAGLELTDMHAVQVETVLDDAGHHRRRAAAVGDQAGKAQQSAPWQRGGAAQVIVIQADHREDVTRKTISGLGLEANVVAVLAPADVQQRQQTMIEKVHERGSNAALLSLLVGQAIKVVTGQWRIRTVQAKEAGLQAIAHLFVIFLNACGLHDVGCRKPQPRMALQTYATAHRITRGPCFQVIAMQGVQVLQQTVKRIVSRVGQQQVS